MAAALITALPCLFHSRHGRSSAVIVARKKVPTRSSGGCWLRNFYAPDVHSSELRAPCTPFEFDACVEGEAESVQGGTVLKAMRDAGVGLLASLVTLAASVQSPLPAFGLEAPEDVTLRDECTEEIASSVVPMEEAVQEVPNESVIQEAWQVVNENFLDARHNSWSADAWLKKKQEVLKNPIRSRMAAYGSIRNMLASLDDPFTRFLTPEQFLQLSKYDVTGIGLNIGESAPAAGEPNLKVIGIILGSPAQLAGVRQGDELLEVAGNSVTGKTAFEAASLIQGPKGTKVSLKVRHNRCSTPQVFELERQQDVRSPVFYRLERVPGSKEMTGFIKLKEFNALAKRDLLTAMKRMQDAGATSFVLDLRDNPGGLVQAGIEISKLFLDEGETVIETVGREAKAVRNVIATTPPVTNAPLTILVNDHTASASEIVAAALHDNCRAVLVGKRTFGKGLIQAVYELSDGSGVVLTVGKYVTPGHQDIDGVGIEPDFNQLPDSNEGLGKLAQCKMMKASANSS
ncbi:carboxyl-terminal-processing peptidase 1, chloroplastic isoform X4 [Physcomitrium patens]|uniref:C-terminal processing peptidase n=1 Tax=Physcomitrium patens TaxID=3218 RepID=A0A2K1J8V9_PHYPA|nr:carboxyl-terminal-processing peptidase 1, chloroplastic-like isoform X4 [Physcomitrium patens]PNR37980.1 hypothetical protein PHYPA_021091 [Physcomitrium patens]|eukprot:XP_024398460.1 carboxyl-terminal-processing peptidase 1, chloroplastic-like isoform X4 [Physcomitrella patens]